MEQLWWAPLSQREHMVLELDKMVEFSMDQYNRKGMAPWDSDYVVTKFLPSMKA